MLNCDFKVNSFRKAMNNIQISAEGCDLGDKELVFIPNYSHEVVITQENAFINFIKVNFWKRRNFYNFRRKVFKPDQFNS